MNKNDKFTFKYNIAVSGSATLNKCTKTTKDKISELGEEIAKNNCALISGATSGVPHLASLACRDAGGFNVGFSPAASKIAHVKTYKLPVDPYDIIIYTGMDYSGRDTIMTKSADAVIIANGRVGTMHEFLVAFETGKIVGVLTETGGVADYIKYFVQNSGRKPKFPIIYSNNPRILIKKVIREIEKKYDC
jgi:uncharacterized protein (TIGR00725 family)